MDHVSTLRPMTCRTVAALAAVALLAAGCGGADRPATDSAGADPAQLTDAQRPPDRLRVEVTIADGRVSPTDADLRATVGQPIVVYVNSDAADELHVNSVPEHTFTIEPGPIHAFQFSVDQPGAVDITLRHLHRRIATVHVHP